MHRVQTISRKGPPSPPYPQRLGHYLPASRTARAASSSRVGDEPTTSGGGRSRQPSMSPRRTRNPDGVSGDVRMRQPPERREQRLVLRGEQPSEISTSVVIPFFERFPLMGAKARDFEAFRAAVHILRRSPLEGGRLHRGPATSRGHEQRREAAAHDGGNPQRLYAELSKWNWRDEIVRSHGRP